MSLLHKPSTVVVPVKSKVEISQNFVAFSEYMNFTSEKNFLVTKNEISPCTKQIRYEYQRWSVVQVMSVEEKTNKYLLT